MINKKIILIMSKVKCSKSDRFPTMQCIFCSSDWAYLQKNAKDRVEMPASIIEMVEMH